MTNWWKRSLAGQFIGVMLLALVVAQIIAFAISWNDRQDVLRETAKTEFYSRTGTLVQLLKTRPLALRHDLLLAGATNYSRFWISAAEPANLESWFNDAQRLLQEPLADLVDRPENAAEPSTATSRSNENRVHNMNLAEENRTKSAWSSSASPLWAYSQQVKILQFSNDDGMGLATPIGDGNWLNAAYYKPLKPILWKTQAVLSIVLTAIVLSVIGVITANRIAKPLRKLASSADALGRGEAIEILDETGPDDIRRMCEAFNRMQMRLRRFVEDRTRMLGAIGHDLRTPLTTLRLRAEFVSDEDLQQKILATVDEIQGMTEATLALAQGESTVEETRTIDLNALIGSLCEDLVELGQKVEFVDGPRTNYRCRPDGIRRAVRNLIENAVRYGGQARVYLRTTSASVDVIIEDKGPGIPSNEIEQVFAPFYRLEQSRNKETGGVGLGLSIARAIIRHHGGDIELSPCSSGLRAAVTLPNS
jgi:signal transduction histidine kinase